MVKWIERSQPQVTTAAVILGYISAVFMIIDSTRNPLVFLVVLALGGGAFGTANNKKIGHMALSAGAILQVAFTIWTFLTADTGQSNVDRSLGDFSPLGLVVWTLTNLNNVVFPVALLVAAIHPQTLQHRKIWFE